MTRMICAIEKNVNCSANDVHRCCTQGSRPTEVATLAAENAMLRRQLAERQQLAASRGGAAAAAEPPRQQLSGDGQQRVLGLDGAWVEQTWVTVRRPSVFTDTCPYPPSAMWHLGLSLAPGAHVVPSQTVSPSAL